MHILIAAPAVRDIRPARSAAAALAAAAGRAAAAAAAARQQAELGTSGSSCGRECDQGTTRVGSSRHCVKGELKHSVPCAMCSAQAVLILVCGFMWLEGCVPAGWYRHCMQTHARAVRTPQDGPATMFVLAVSGPVSMHMAAAWGNVSLSQCSIHLEQTTT